MSRNDRNEIDNKIKEIIEGMIAIKSSVMKGYMFIEGKQYNYSFLIEPETKHGEKFSKLLKEMEE